MFIIETENLKLSLQMVRVESLLEHEEILADVADRLLFEFKNWGTLHNPIIVDQHNIVLDGNHRAYVFKKLNFKTISVCKIDYFSDTVGLRYWYRLFGGVKGRHELIRSIETLGGDVRTIPDKQTLLNTLEANVFLFGIQHGTYFAVIRFPGHRLYDAVTAYLLLDEIQSKLLQTGKKMEYIPCQSVTDAAFCEALNADDLIIYTPRITKEMVVEAAKEKKIFIPKTTRHLVAARPLNINVPISWFREDTPLEEMNKRFLTFLNKKKIKRFGPGQVIDGRYYEEELFVFYD